MEGRKFFRTIRLQNILSFGPDTPELALEPLNVLIGPNASGKSNLIEALSLLQAAPRDLQEPIRRGGGVRDWLWKGTASTPTATIDVTTDHQPKQGALRYRLSFTSDILDRFAIVDEVIEDEKPETVGEEPCFYYRYQGSSPVIKAIPPGNKHPLELLFAGQKVDRVERALTRQDLKSDQSILSQVRDSYAYPELWHMWIMLEILSFYRELYLGRDAPLRLPQKPDLPQDILLEDASNLSLVLNNLQNHPRCNGPDT